MVPSHSRRAVAQKRQWPKKVGAVSSPLAANVRGENSLDNHNCSFAALASCRPALISARDNFGVMPAGYGDVMSDVDGPWQKYLAENPKELQAFNVAVELCDKVGPDFMPNLMLDLRWREPISKDQSARDVEWLFFSIELLIYGREWSPIEHAWRMPYLVAIRNKGQVKQCRIWAQFNEQLIDRPLMEKVPILWTRVGGRCRELGVGQEGAFNDLVQACKAKDGVFLFSFLDQRALVN
jgi:hypothetical protein